MEADTQTDNKALTAQSTATGAADNIDAAILHPTAAVTNSVPDLVPDTSADEEEYVESIVKLESDLDTLLVTAAGLSNAAHDQQRVQFLVQYVNELSEYLKNLNNVIILRHNLFGANQ
jgi:hypothetical protein